MPTVSTTGLYPFNPYGNDPNALVLNELQALQDPGRDDFYFIIPKAAPFFAKSLVVRDDVTGTVYTEGVDYVVGHWFVEAMNQTGRPLAGSIRFLKRSIGGVVSLTYQTLGGEWGFDDAAILKELSNKAVNPLSRAWAQIDVLPATFPPIPHEQRVDELIGFEEVVSEISKIADAITATGDSNESQHALSTNNPHSVTKAQVGLGNVENYSMATNAEAIAGLRSDRFMSPATTRTAVEQLTDTLVGGHLTDTNNPHSVTKAQVGLGSVQNYPMATLLQAEEGLRADVYMSAESTARAVSVQAGEPLGNHQANTSNPHSVTKAQVGLGFVNNYSIASQSEMIEGIRSDRYTTPQRVFEAIDYHAVIPLAMHEADVQNPHGVTPQQIGTLPEAAIITLVEGRLAAGGTATNSERVFGMDKPALYSDIIDQANVPLYTHINDTSNPHGVTPTQIGTLTAADINTLIAGRLPLEGTAANSVRLFSMERDELYRDIYGESGYAWNDTFAIQDAGNTNFVKLLSRAAGGFGSSWTITHKTSTGEFTLYQIDIPSEVDPMIIRRLNETAVELTFMTSVINSELVLWVRCDAGEPVVNLTEISGEDLQSVAVFDPFNPVIEPAPTGTGAVTVPVIGSNEKLITAIAEEFDAATALLTA